MIRRALPVAVLCVALTGCGDDGLDEVREFVKNAHADRKPRVEPLPEIKTQEAFVYGAHSLPDPFSVVNIRGKAAPGGGAGPRPDPNRRKEALEEFPLDALRMVGTLQRRNLVSAVIQAPDGTVHRLKVGDHMGQNFGMITKITEEKINLVELIQGALGDWVERETSIALSE